MRGSMLAAARRLAAATLVFGSSLHAQTWVTLPNGELGYITNYTTTGFFQCGDPFYMIGSCSTSGNSITLGSGGNSMTMAFQGLTQLILATNTPQQVLLGSLTKSFGGNGPFAFPTSKNINVPLFFFSMMLKTSNPLMASGTWTGGYLPLSLTAIPVSCCNLNNYVAFPTSSPPPGYGYSLVNYDGFFGTTMTVNPGAQMVGANVAILPEPATLWLTGTGLVGLGAFVRRRRRQAQ